MERERDGILFPMSIGKTSRVYLVGFMGSGKTVVGELVARELGYRFIDLDREIEKSQGMCIAEIFEQDGEVEFRRLEALTLREIGDEKSLVVATGGGSLTQPGNLELIRRTGLTIWLDAPLSVLLRRCGEGPERPLLAGEEAMRALLLERLPGYREADMRVETEGRSPEEIAALIASRIDVL